MYIVDDCRAQEKTVWKFALRKYNSVNWFIRNVDKLWLNKKKIV